MHIWGAWLTHTYLGGLVDKGLFGGAGALALLWEPPVRDKADMDGSREVLWGPWRSGGTPRAGINRRWAAPRRVGGISLGPSCVFITTLI